MPRVSSPTESPLSNFYMVSIGVLVNLWCSRILCNMSEAKVLGVLLPLEGPLSNFYMVLIGVIVNLWFLQNFMQYV